MTNRNNGATVGRGQPCSGMTLIEVLIATVVLALGFAGILGTAIQVIRMARMTREDTQAVAAAQHALEVVKTYSWTRLSLISGESVFDISRNSVFAALNDPSCKVTVTPVEGETNRLRMISAKVRWRRSNGKYGEKELASFVARKKLL